MREDDSFCKGLLDSLHDGVYFVDHNRRITYWNRGAERISGYNSSEVIGMSCSDNLLMHVNEEGDTLCRRSCPLADTLKDGRVRESEVYLKHRDGHRVPVFIRVSPLLDSYGQVVGAVESFNDTSPNAALLERIEGLQRLALLDPLTELPNRRCINMKLRSRIDEMGRYGWPCGVLFVDIDNFKVVNDAFGHIIGDRVLKMVARTLSSSLRSYDILGRYGGEEFIAIIANVNSTQLYSFANRLRLLVEKSNLNTNSGTVSVTISIGATLARSNDTLDSVIKRADQLMYHSKAAGRNRVSLEQPASQTEEPHLHIVKSSPTI